MTQGEVCRMVAAEAASQRDQMRVAVFDADKRNDLGEQIGFVLQMARGAPTRRRLPVVPALHVDRVDAEDLQLAGVDFAGERGDHAAVFKLVEAAAGGGKDHYGCAGVAECE